MAIYHLSVKTVSRSAGRSATAAAAYRAGVAITDERTGEHHDYTRKGGVVSADLVLPESAPAWAADRSALWNAAEQSEKRKNSTVAREFEIALPAELDAEQRRALALDFAGELVKRHGCAADVAVHEGGRGGDERNHHAHILLTTRRLGPDGFGEKTRELDDQKTGKVLVTEWRERFADLQNDRLRAAGHSVQVDHRTLAAQGIEREPTRHLGPVASAIERRTGEPSEKRQRWDAEAQERLERAAAQGAELLEAARAEVKLADGDLRQALYERDIAEMQAARAAEVERERAAAAAEFEAARAQEKAREAAKAPEPMRWVRPSKRRALEQEHAKKEAAAVPVVQPPEPPKPPTVEQIRAQVIEATRAADPERRALADAVRGEFTGRDLSEIERAQIDTTQEAEKAQERAAYMERGGEGRAGREWKNRIWSAQRMARNAEEDLLRWRRAHPIKHRMGDIGAGKLWAEIDEARRGIERVEQEKPAALQLDAQELTETKAAASALAGRRKALAALLDERRTEEKALAKADPQGPEAQKERQEQERRDAIKRRTEEWERRRRESRGRSRGR